MRGKVIKNPRIGKWYIVSTDHRDLNGNFNLINKEFNTKKEAQDIVDAYMVERKYYIEVVSGEEALKYNFKFRKNYWKSAVYKDLVKYIYPDERTNMTPQQKKSFRTKQRREWRRSQKKKK